MDQPPTPDIEHAAPYLPNGEAFWLVFSCKYRQLIDAAFIYS